jgi:hypothetical protein
MADYCRKNAIQLVYAGDNDAAGEKLRAALDEVTGYRVKQPPKEYKDWGDFLEATDVETVQNYCMEELFGPTVVDDIPPTIADKWADAKITTAPPDLFENNVAVPQDRKEQSGTATVLF